jgi:hypothetical protein
VKIIELLNNKQPLQMPITNEEAELLEKFKQGEVQRQDLNEREIVVANAMVNKDVLYRQNENGRIIYHKKF